MGVQEHRAVAQAGVGDRAPGAAFLARRAPAVLLLFDEDRALPGLSVLERTLRSTLSAGLEDDVEFFAESLNAAQFPDEDHDRVERDYYVNKYSGRKLDLIVGVKPFYETDGT